MVICHIEWVTDNFFSISFVFPCYHHRLRLDYFLEVIFNSFGKQEALLEHTILAPNTKLNEQTSFAFIFQVAIRLYTNQILLLQRNLTSKTMRSTRTMYSEVCIVVHQNTESPWQIHPGRKMEGNSLILRKI